MSPIIGSFDKFLHNNKIDKIIDIRFSHSIKAQLDLITTIFLMITLYNKSGKIKK